jgi:hypothetical protein
MPSARAVCRLMMNSNLVGCRIGRSASFFPVRMRPTRSQGNCSPRSVPQTHAWSEIRQGVRAHRNRHHQRMQVVVAKLPDSSAINSLPADTQRILTIPLTSLLFMHFSQLIWRDTYHEAERVVRGAQMARNQNDLSEVVTRRKFPSSACRPQTSPTVVGSSRRPTCRCVRGFAPCTL